MASEATPAGGISSVFAKKKGKKGKKTKGSNLNIDSCIPKTEEKPKIEKLQEILGGPGAAEDDGWDDVVEKKSVVATGGKQVSDLINMTALMTEDESTAAKLEKQDIKQAFHDARTLKESERKDEPTEAAKEVKQEEATTKPKGLSGDIFGGAAARGGIGLGGGWKQRMEERELKQRQEALSVENTSAFPSLKDAMSAPVKPKQSAPDPEANRWVRRQGGGSSAAAAAIKAALGRTEEEEKSAPSPKVDAPPPPPAAAGERAGAGASAPAVPVAAAASGEESKVTEPTWVPAASHSDGGGTVEKAAEGVAAVAIAEEEVVVVADKEALVQQFGKKKKKKKKPAAEEGAGGEP